MKKALFACVALLLLGALVLGLARLLAPSEPPTPEEFFHPGTPLVGDDASKP